MPWYHGISAKNQKLIRVTVTEQWAKMRKNARMCAHLVHFHINSVFFALISWYQGTSVNYHKQWFFSSLNFDFKGAADFFKCTFQCEYALLNFFLLTNMSYFSEYHWNPFDLNWYLIFLYFQTALTSRLDTSRLTPPHSTGLTVLDWLCWRLDWHH